MILMRLARGVKEHFSVRAMEWLMAYVLLGTYAVFQIQPEVFVGRPSFEYLGYYASAATWTYICAICGIVRLAALVVNGTFRNKFPYTPHLRVVASLMSLAFWSQFSLGFVHAYRYGEGIAFAVLCSSAFVLAELINVYRSFSDVGETIRKRN